MGVVHLAEHRETKQRVALKTVRVGSPGSVHANLLGGIRREIQALRRLYHPGSCAACGHTGYRGRIALVELLIVDEDVSRLVLARAEAREIERAAIAASMRTMLADGLNKAATGQTTIEEVLRVTREA